MLRCVDMPAGLRNQRSEDGRSTTSGTYDRVDDSDRYSRYSDYGYGKSITENSVGDGTKPEDSLPTQPSIATRPPMKTPDQSPPLSSDSQSEEHDNDFPLTGRDLMKGLETKISSSGGDLNAMSEELRNRKEHRIYASGTVKSFASSSEDDYDYTCINDLPRPLGRPPHPPSSSSSSGIVATTPKISTRRNNSAVPLDCFQTIRVKVVEGNEVDNPLGITSGQIEWKTYLSSTGFFTYFTEAFYEWSQRLERTSHGRVEEATTFKSAINCVQFKSTPPSQHGETQYRTTVEYHPAIPVPQWPEIASEWRTRKRTPVRDQRTNIDYRWPSAGQVDAVIQLGCHLTAEGGKALGRSSPSSRLEWQLNFGAAHELLMSSLSHQQLRALLWARIVFKHVLAPLGILYASHLETVLFWMIEADYIDWPEAGLGERIIAIFHTMHECLRKRKMSHYFLRKRNMLSTRAPRDLSKAQERLFRLVEGFVPQAFQAARHLIAGSTANLPMPDLSRLWEIITTPSLTAIQNIIHPGLLPAGSHRRLDTIGSISGNESGSEVRTNKKKANKNGKPADEGFWEKQKQEQDKTRELLREKRARLEKEENKKRRQDSAGDSEYGTANRESKSLEGTPIGHFNIGQTKMLLEFFIKHFIETAQCAIKMRANSTAHVLIDQADNLAALLKEEGFYDQADQYRETIEELRTVTLPSRFTEPIVDIPGTPCVFPTGADPRPISNMSNFSYISGIASSESFNYGRHSMLTAPKLPTPLPETPPRSERFDYMSSNGNAILPTSYEQDNNTLKVRTTSTTSTRVSKENSPVGPLTKAITTTVVIETKMVKEDASSKIEDNKSVNGPSTIMNGSTSTNESEEDEDEDDQSTNM